MRRSAAVFKPVFAAAAILILAAGCTQSPTAPSTDSTLSPSGVAHGVYANGEGANEEDPNGGG